MCRIAGSVNDNSNWIETANDHQKRGGKDHQGIMTKGNVSFGHCLLSIINYQEQPVESARYMMVFNGCLYNFKSLYPSLNSDTIAALMHFEVKGIKAVDDFNFMGAIGLYDIMEQKVHLFVDRFAQKNLYYYHRGNKFYFASNPAALYNLEPLWSIDKYALQSYWLLGSVMGSDSIFCGIKKLCASEHLTYDIRENQITIECYWEPQFQENTSGIEDLVLDAINKTKVSDVPIHIFLSGGIDSTLVASQFSNGNAIHLDSPERQYAQQVADKFNIDLKIIKPETIETEQYLTDYSIFSGEPTMAGVIPYTVAKEVSKYGKVAITANGADELFFGYDRTSEQISDKQFHHIMRNLPKSGYTVDFYKFSSGRRFELNSYVQFDLNKTLDFASMCHGLEVRAPFLDHRLVEMALSIHEREHRKPDNKTILKRMLGKMGFDHSFLNRAKMGFSLFRHPERLDELIKQSWKWVHENGFLNVNHLNLSGRDKRYLEMSALGFYYWFKAWEHKIK